MDCIWHGWAVHTNLLVLWAFGVEVGVGVGVGVVTEDFAAISLREKAPFSQKPVEERQEPIWMPAAQLMQDVRSYSGSILAETLLLRPTQAPLDQSPKDPDPRSAFSSSNSRLACAFSSV